MIAMHDAPALAAHSAGADPHARPTDALLATAYDELRSLADLYLAGERHGHTLQATALIHEAWMRLASAGTFVDRSHFIGVASRVMRQVLVDHARRRATLKRGGGRARCTLEPAAATQDPDPADVLALDEALDGLAARRPRAARVLELRAFGGLTIRETAAVLGVATCTVEDDWAVARAWLARELADD